jgi:hypothetical protein
LRETDLADCDGGGGEELRGFALKSVQGVETEEGAEETGGVGVQG